jgi:preprotein translocase subunit SecA
VETNETVNLASSVEWVRESRLLLDLVTITGQPSPPQPVTKAPAGRNEPCPCGSGKKYKKCCRRS